jgi:4,5-dihydroxyphthalate decarboxylase
MALRTVLGDHGQTAALKSGEIKVEGVELAFETFKRMPDAYRRQARTAEFDICELAPTTYLVARAMGTPITALPIPMTRRFRHAGLVRRANSDIREPRDLEGKRVGIRAYTVTAGTWTRGVLAEEYGLDTSKVHWFTEEEENVPGVVLPPNVTRVDGRKLSEMFAAGELDAGFAGLAGIGDPADGESFVDLFEQPAPIEAEWFRKTGIYPIHGLITVRDETLAAHPGLPRALMDAFVAAKALYLDAVMSGEREEAEDRRYRKLADLVGDPLPYGFDANRPALEALVRYATNQGFVRDLPPLEALVLPIEPAQPEE